MPFSALATIWSGHKNRQSARRTQRRDQQFSADQARINRQFQERMASTSHQRQVQDLEAAGLNPILAAGGSGSPQPSGAQGHATGTPGQQPDLGATVNTAFTARQQRKLLAAQADNAKQQNELLKEETRIKSAEADRAELLKAPYGAGLSVLDRVMGSIDDVSDRVRSSARSISRRENQDIDRQIEEMQRSSAGQRTVERYNTRRVYQDDEKSSFYNQLVTAFGVSQANSTMDMFLRDWDGSADHRRRILRRINND